ncbi:MAG: DUF2975 domain-containing protein [Enterococcus sp.]
MKLNLFFLKSIVYGVALVFALVGFLLYIQLSTNKSPLNFNWQTILFLVAIYLGLLFGIIISFLMIKLLTNISLNQTFSSSTQHVLSRIRQFIGLIAISSLAILPKFLQVADADDAPGLMLLGLSIVFLPFAGLMLMNIIIQILEEAVRLKKDDELTV